MIIKNILLIGFFLIFIVILIYLFTIIFEYNLDQNIIYILYICLGIGSLLILLGLIFLGVKYKRKPKKIEQERKELENIIDKNINKIDKYINISFLSEIRDTLENIKSLFKTIKDNLEYVNNNFINRINLLKFDELDKEIKSYKELKNITTQKNIDFEFNIINISNEIYSDLLSIKSEYI